MTTSSFNFLPIIPLAIGESFEILPSIGFASALPTIVYVSSSPSGNSINVTFLPMIQHLFQHCYRQLFQQNESFFLMLKYDLQQKLVHL